MNGIAIRYPMSVASPAGRSPPVSLATMIPTWTSSRISRTPTAARRGTLIRRFRAVISSAYPASARPAMMIVVGTAPFTLEMLLRYVVTGAGPGSEAPLDRGFRLALFPVHGRAGQRYRLGNGTGHRQRREVPSPLTAQAQ